MQVQPDWFALGVTVFVLNCDKQPFRGREPEEIDKHTCETVIADGERQGKYVSCMVA